MNVLYLSLSYVPSRRASSVQVMQMCAALARRGHRVTLVAKQSREPLAAGLDDHAFYGVPATFAVEKVPRPKRRGGGVLYMAGVAAQILSRRREVDLVYCRDIVGAAIAGEVGLPVVFEAHGLPERRWEAAAWRRLVARPNFRGLVAISEALRRDVVADGLAPARAPLVIAHDAADPPDGRAARQGLGAPPRVGYVGNLYPGRGIELVLDLAARMPSVCFDVVGGADADVARLRALGVTTNLRLHGFCPPSQLRRFYDELDVLLMPYPREAVVGPTGTLDTSRWCSPMKMFEYMASGAAMVSSDLPVLQEVLGHERNALIAPAGDVDAWRSSIERLLGDGELRHRLAATALDDLRREHTWDARAARVMGGLGLA